MTFGLWACDKSVLEADAAALRAMVSVSANSRAISWVSGPIRVMPNTAPVDTAMCAPDSGER
jgi:hypothetical protein